MINKITFKNYKSFKNKQSLVLKPITVLIGKNSSGKSAVAKLLTLIDASLKGDTEEPLMLKNYNVELGAEFRDLVHRRNATGGNKGSIELGITSDNESLKVTIAPKDKSENNLEFYSWIYNDVEKITHNTDSKAFKGFISEDIIFKELNIDTDYIGPIRCQPQRSYELNSITNRDKFGTHGDRAYDYLISDSLKSENLLLDSVSNWYKKNFNGWGINIIPLTNNIYQIELNNGFSKINIKDVGQGMSQVLPLVIRAFKKSEVNSLIILEQPELHLHPAAHGNLAELFTTSVNNDENKKYLIETHSQNFLLRLRRLVAEKKLKVEDVIFYNVDYNEESGESNLEEILVDLNGHVSYWPKDVFNETLDETIALRDAQLDNK